MNPTRRETAEDEVVLSIQASDMLAGLIASGLTTPCLRRKVSTKLCLLLLSPCR